MKEQQTLKKDSSNARRNQRWVIIAFFFLSGILTATWSSRIPDLQSQLNLSNAALGTVLFAIPAGLLVGLSVAGWLVATYGTKKILLISCFFSAIFLCLAAISSTVWLLMFVLLLIGITRTIYNLSANTAAIEVQGLYSQSIMASFHGVWSLACFLAAGLGQLMINSNIPLINHFLTTGFLAVLIALVATRKRVSTHTVPERRPLFVKPDKYLLLLGLIGLCAMLCEGAMFDWSVNYFQKVVKADRSYVTVGYLCFVITMAAGRLVGDKFIASYGVYRMLIFNGLIMGVGFCIAALFPQVLPAAIGFLLIGIGDATLVPIIYILAARSQKMPPSYALSSVTLIGYTGFLIGPLFIGNVSEYWSMQVAFLCLSMLSIAIIILSLNVKRLSHLNV